MSAPAHPPDFPTPIQELTTSEAYIIDAVRTPRGIGKVGKGALADMHPQHLVAAVGSGNARLQAAHPQSHQGVCGDAIASMEGITREALDALALESQKRAALAIAEGRFSRSVIPIYREDGTLALDHDEFPRPGTTAEGLAALEPSFAKLADVPLDAEGNTFRSLINRRYPDFTIEHVHHAGNSSGVVDGAAAILLASGDYAREHGLKPRAQIVAAVNMGDCPTLMLNAPVPAARKALAQAGLGVDDIDLWEINEAFAVVAEKFIRDLELDRAKVKVNGGAMALDRGHADRHCTRRTGTDRGALRTGDHLRRRRNGPGDHHRADLGGPARRAAKAKGKRCDWTH